MISRKEKLQFQLSDIFCEKLVKRRTRRLLPGKNAPNLVQNLIPHDTHQSPLVDELKVAIRCRRLDFDYNYSLTCDKMFISPSYPKRSSGSLRCQLRLLPSIATIIIRLNPSRFFDNAGPNCASACHRSFDRSCDDHRRRSTLGRDGWVGGIHPLGSIFSHTYTPSHGFCCCREATLMT